MELYHIFKGHYLASYPYTHCKVVPSILIISNKNIATPRIIWTILYDLTPTSRFKHMTDAFINILGHLLITWSILAWLLDVRCVLLSEEFIDSLPWTMSHYASKIGWDVSTELRYRINEGAPPHPILIVWWTLNSLALIKFRIQNSSWPKSRIYKILCYRGRV